MDFCLKFVPTIHPGPISIHAHDGSSFFSVFWGVNNVPQSNPDQSLSFHQLQDSRVHLGRFQDPKFPPLKCSGLWFLSLWRGVGSSPFGPTPMTAGGYYLLSSSSQWTSIWSFRWISFSGKCHGIYEKYCHVCSTFPQALIFQFCVPVKNELHAKLVNALKVKAYISVSHT